MRSPVAVIAFRRLDTTQRVLDRVRAARPPRVYAICDGPRAERPDEAERVAAVRALFDDLERELPVTRIYAETNLGLRRRILTGLSSVFEDAEEAVILEDDCVPSADFFRFSDELLERWRDEPNVKAISGSNFQRGIRRGPASYYFSQFFACWGWATWRRAWQEVDTSTALAHATPGSEHVMRLWLRDNALAEQFLDWTVRSGSGALDAWSFVAHASWLRTNGVYAVPQRNLSSNLGFDAEAVHTRDARSPLAAAKTEALAWPLIHPVALVPDSDADAFTRDVVLRGSVRMARLHEAARRIATRLHLR
jgi:hypothetical protein